MMHLHNFIWAQFPILRILMSGINAFQGQIKYFIDTCSFFFKVKLCFSSFSRFGGPKPVFPGRYLLVNTMVKTGYRPKPSNPASEN